MADKLMLTVAQVAARLELGETKVKELIGDGTIVSVAVGRNRRVRAADLEAYVASLQPSLPTSTPRTQAAAAGRTAQSTKVRAA